MHKPGDGIGKAPGFAPEDRLRFLDSVVENANDAILVTEAEPVEEPGPRIVYVNRAFTRMTGYAAEEVLGATPRILQGSDTDPASRDEIRRALENWRPVLVEIVNYRKDGSAFWVELNIVPVADGEGRYTHWVSVQRDVTQRRRREAADLRLWDRAMTASSNGIIITDPNQADNPIVYVNPAIERITGYLSEEMLGRNARFLRGSDADQPDLERLRPAIEQARDFYGVLRNYRKDGTLFWNEMYVSPVRDEEGRVTHFVGVQNDVTERVTLKERLEYQATHDPLTDLPNRRLLSGRIGDSAGSGVAVLFVDLDGFKVVNDSLGHDAGDRLLVGVAGRLAECLGDRGTAARFGGDKFVVLLDAVGEAERTAVDLSEALRPPFHVDGRELFVTASIGIALGAAGGAEPGRLLRDADLAMHQAKKAGKNRHALFEESMDAAARERLELQGDLRRALEADQFEVHYQPLVSLRTGAALWAEALVRWRRPGRGLIPPGEFVPAAEENGLIVPIDRWVLREACRRAKGWQGTRPWDPSPGVSVNLSARQFARDELVGEVASVLDEVGLEPSALILEITEGAVMADVRGTVAVLEEFKELGVRIALDDFGTGYSSLSYLKRFPVDYVKIDRSMVTGLHEDHSNRAIVLSTITLAHALDLEVVAEGVETAGEHEVLRDLRCDLGQGYLFARPLPGKEAGNLLTAGLRHGMVNGG